MTLAGSSLDWYLARASGVVAYLLLTAVVVVGVTLAGKLRLRWPKFAVVDVHRFGSLLVGVFVGLHVLTLALDTYLPFSVVQLVVPFASHYRPLPTALGIVAVELLLAVAITNRLRSRLPYKLWRRAHFLTFAVWLAATGHGLTAGSDRGSLWLNAIYLFSVAGVLTGLGHRISRTVRPELGLARIALPSCGLALLATLVLGTSPAAPAAHPPNAFAGTLTATVSDRSGQALALTSVSGSAHANRRLVFRIDLLGNGQQVAATALQLRYAGARPAACSGTVTHLDTSGFTGTCRFADGTTQSVTASWRLSGSSLAGHLSLGLAA